MSVFTIADLHLSGSSDHAMDVFGSRWRGYTEKILRRWSAVIKEEDTVILPGDISWAMTLPEAKADLTLLDSLPGRKLLGKGNHDFWWDTAAKMHRFFAECRFHSLDILYNNAHIAEDLIVCGTRGWFLDEAQQQTVGAVDYGKIVRREAQRLRLSLNAATALRHGENAQKEIVVFLHFPPVWNDFVCPEILELLQLYEVRRCFFGHIHGAYQVPPVREVNGVSLSLISADYLNFTPFRISPN